MAYAGIPGGYKYHLTVKYHNGDRITFQQGSKVYCGTVVDSDGMCDIGVKVSGKFFTQRVHNSQVKMDLVVGDRVRINCPASPHHNKIRIIEAMTLSDYRPVPQVLDLGFKDVCFRSVDVERVTKEEFKNMTMYRITMTGYKSHRDSGNHFKDYSSILNFHQIQAPNLEQAVYEYMKEIKELDAGTYRLLATWESLSSEPRAKFVDVQKYITIEIKLDNGEYLRLP